jgi:hypothetical protein
VTDTRTHTGALCGLGGGESLAARKETRCFIRPALQLYLKACGALFVDVRVASNFHFTGHCRTPEALQSLRSAAHVVFAWHGTEYAE